MAEPSDVSPDLAAFHALFAEMSAIGATPAGGVHRLAADAADGAARDRLCAWLDEAGFAVRVDEVGNVFGLATLVEGAPFVLLGSHLDSQPKGGRFDGAYGVVAACLAARTVVDRLSAAGETPSWNIAVVDWTNEEGTRFQPSLLGSSVAAGGIAAGEALGARDELGITLGKALAGIGYAGRDARPHPVACLLELHVEQGRELEDGPDRIGVVTGSWAALKCQVRFKGEPTHTGPTRMADRRDALLAAAKAVVAVSELALADPGRIHSSVGRFDVRPNSPNVVASQVDAFVEFRACDPEVLTPILSRFERRLEEIAAETGTRAELVSRTLRGPQDLDPDLVLSVSAVACRSGLASRHMKTVAGHDAVAMAALCPSALIFVPSVGGISHNEAEFTASEDLEAGLALLSDVALALCRTGSIRLFPADDVVDGFAHVG